MVVPRPCSGNEPEDESGQQDLGNEANGERELQVALSDLNKNRHFRPSGEEKSSDKHEIDLSKK
jgi:hypothetical protein